MNASGGVANGIGQPVRRKEDFRLLTGRGCYVDDLALAGCAHAVIVRSPHAHARIVSIDTAAALAAPGVLAVLTGADYLADGLGPIPHAAGLMSKPDLAGAPAAVATPITTRALPDAGRHRARSSASRSRWSSPRRSPRPRTPPSWSTSSYEALPAVVRAGDAIEPGAPQLWDEAPGNLCIDIEVGDEAATDAAFARRGACRAARHLDPARHRRADGAAHQHRRIRRRRRGCYTLYSGSGRGVAEAAARPRAGARRAARAGARACAATWAAISARAISSIPNTRCSPGRRSGSAGRSSGPASGPRTFLSDYQGRDLTVEAELALDADGNFLAVRGTQPQQSRRPGGLVRVPAEGARADVERLPHPGRLFPRPRRRDQHDADHPLPQRRPARGRSLSSSG